MFVRSQHIVSVFLCAALSSCNLEPKYDAPVVATPQDWKSEVLVGNPLPKVEYWWEIFQDPVLSWLEQEAVNNNYTLEIAAERVVQARDYALIVKSKLYPQINLPPAYSNQDILTKLFGQNSNQGTTGQALTSSLSRSGKQNPSNLIREHQLLYALPLSLSYEVDLWGKLRGEYRAALLDAKARAQAYNTALLVLTTDLAVVYYQLRTLDNQIDVYRKIIETRNNALEIVRSRYETRITDYSTVAQAEFELTNTIALLQEAERERVILEDQMAVLLGMPASEFSLAPELIRTLPPVVPPSIPSEVLLQRPDLAEQEFKMASIHQQIGVAYASYFPAIELTAGLGFSSPISKDFMKWKSRYWGFGTDIFQYVFDAGARDANVQLTWSQFRAAAFDYQQRVLVAFEEVENALSNLDLLSQQSQSVQLSVQAAHKAYVIACDRYKNGITNYLEVIIDERQELESAQTLLGLLGLRYVNTVQLIKALGGSWKTVDLSIDENI